MTTKYNVVCWRRIKQTTTRTVEAPDAVDAGSLVMDELLSGDHDGFDFVNTTDHYDYGVDNVYAQSESA